MSTRRWCWTVMATLVVVAGCGGKTSLGEESAPAAFPAPDPGDLGDGGLPDTGSIGQLVCNDDRIRGVLLAPAQFTVGDYCDEVTVCLSSSAQAALRDIAPQAQCQERGPACGTHARCLLFRHATVTEEQWRQLCEASLLDDVSDVLCVVYGP